MRTRVIPVRPRSVITTRRYTKPRLSLPLPPIVYYLTRKSNLEYNVSKMVNISISDTSVEYDLEEYVVGSTTKFKSPLFPVVVHDIV